MERSGQKPISYILSSLQLPLKTVSPANLRNSPRPGSDHCPPTPCPNISMAPYCLRATWSMLVVFQTPPTYLSCLLSQLSPNPAPSHPPSLPLEILPFWPRLEESYVMFFPSPHSSHPTLPPLGGGGRSHPPCCSPHFKACLATHRSLSGSTAPAIYFTCPRLDVVL